MRTMQIAAAQIIAMEEVESITLITNQIHAQK